MLLPLFIISLFFIALSTPAKDFSKSAYAVQRGLASMERIDRILEAQNEIENPEKPKKLQFNRHIHYNHVWFTYQSDWVLKDINLVIPKGKQLLSLENRGPENQPSWIFFLAFTTSKKGEFILMM